MLQGNPFADLIPNAAAPPARAPVLGTPRPPAAQTPAAAQGDVLRNTRTQQEIDAAAREAARLAADPAGDAGADQRRSAGFFGRALNSGTRYDRLNVGPRGLTDDVIAETFPRIQNYRDDPQRQTAESYIRDFIGATLRYESGAAIPPAEFENQRRTFFPMPGDGPEVIAAKRQLRQQAIDALRIGAGPAAASVPPVLGAQDVEASIERARDGHVAVDGTVSGASRLGPDGLEIDIVGGTREPPPQPPAGGYLNDLAVGVGDIVEGAGDILGLVANPLNAGINWATGSNLGTDLGQAARDATGLPSPRGGQQELASAVNRGGIGALTMAGLAGGGARLATGALQSAAQRLASTPLVDTVAGASAGGASDATRQAGYGTTAQLLAALGGGGAGVMAAQRAGRSLAPSVAASHPLVNAGRAENVTVNRAMVDPSRQSRVTGVEGTIFGGPIVRGEMDRIGSQIEGRVEDLGRGGTALDDANLGETVQRSAARYIGRSGARAREMYDAAETASEGVRVQPVRSLQVIDEVASRLAETGNINSAELTFLNGLREDLANDLSVGALRRIRTQLRKRISNGGLVFGEDERTVLGVMDAASQDIEDGLRAAGRNRAATLFRRADDNYRDRMSFINDAVQRLVGRRNANTPPGQVAANLRSMAAPRGDNAGLARMMREMEPEERADIAATFAQGLGRNARGDFSTAFLVRQASALPRRARVNIFGEQGAESIENLITLAREHSRVASGLNNSRTGPTNDWRSLLTNAVLGGGLGLTGGSTTAALGATGVAGTQVARDVLTARALMSPNITRWLRDIPRGSAVGPVRQHIARLSQIAAREPSISGDIQQLQQGLLRALNDNLPQPGRVAAQSNEQGPSDADQ